MQDRTPSPAPTCCSQFPKCRCLISTIRDVTRALQYASEKDLNDNQHRFIPRGALFDILSHQRVKELLQKSLGCVGEDERIYSLAEYISPSKGICHCRHEMCTGGRIIFAALMFIEKESLIVTFQSTNPRICDKDLPPQTRTPQLGTDRRIPEVFQNPKDKELFHHWQWQMRSPYFKKRGENADAYEEFVDEVALPWTDVEKKTDPERTDSRDGEMTTVQRIKIHPDHHSVGSGHDDFALKIFEERLAGGLAKEFFRSEINANQKAPIHDRIVPLLVAFKHRGKFYLLFPWAHEGNLQELWRRYSPFENSESKLPVNNPTEWLVGECSGLAESLAATHERSTTTQVNDQSTSVCQLHADIKPANIVCFESSSEGDKSFTLKLADFGLAKQVGPDSTLEATSVAHLKTYRPPEQDMEERLSLKFDVWCLGCVYLEFITWAILGSPGIEGFGRGREIEGNDLQISRAKGKVLEDTFFKKVVRHPSLLNYLHVKMRHKVVTKVYEKKRLAKRYSLWIENSGTQITCEVKEKVRSHIMDLQQHPRCNPKLKSFLSFIKDSMLLIDVGERAKSDTVRDFLNQLKDDIQPSTR